MNNLSRRCEVISFSTFCCLLLIFSFFSTVMIVFSLLYRLPAYLSLIHFTFFSLHACAVRASLCVFLSVESCKVVDAIYDKNWNKILEICAIVHVKMVAMTINGHREMAAVVSIFAFAIKWNCAKWECCHRICECWLWSLVFGDNHILRE